MVNVAINGFGRIGRNTLRAAIAEGIFDKINYVAINDPGLKPEDAARIFKYDSVMGRFNGTVEAYEEGIIVNGKKIKFFAEKDPAQLPWKDLGVEVVVESTGFFTDAEKAKAHIAAGAKKVIISAPAKGVDMTVVYNVNHEKLTGSEQIISAASCTTNCLAPIAKVLNDKFGIVKGFMTTVHAYTGDQNVLDAPHKKGIQSRRARAAAANIVPTTTGAAKAVAEALPELKGKLDGMALRVPTITGSVVDLVWEPARPVTVEEVNAAVKAAANETIFYTEDPIVSSDVIGQTCGTLFDAQCTKIMEVDGKQLVKVITWYDNEMSYTAQMVRTAKYLVEHFK